MRRREAVLDGALSIAVFAATTALLVAGGFGASEPGGDEVGALGVVLAAGASLPLAVSRRAPLAAFAVIAAATTGLVAGSYPLDAPLGAMLAAYRLGAAAGSDAAGRLRWTQPLAVAGFVAAMAGALAVRGPDLAGFAPELGFWALLVGAAWLAGDRARLRREHLEDLRERLERAERDAERDRRLAAAEERTRLARELHDSAGHAVSVILVEADNARPLQERDPARARQAIETVETVARTTIGEIDELVGALRERDARPLPPVAHPSALSELVDEYRSGGLEIRADVSGGDLDVPRSVAWAAYRILQEALTNAARHGTGTAEVAVSFRRPHVEVRVANAIGARGGGHDGDRTGYGLLGMRERAALLGGSLDVDADDERFCVSARLPYRAEAS